jgi:hypothetical protein
MAAALHTLAIRHGVSEVGVAAGPYYAGEAATLELPRDADWRRLHQFLTDVAESAGPGIDVKLDARHGDLSVAVVPLTDEAAAECADELEQRAEGR